MIFTSFWSEQTRRYNETNLNRISNDKWNNPFSGTGTPKRFESLFIPETDYQVIKILRWPRMQMIWMRMPKCIPSNSFQFETDLVFPICLWSETLIVVENLQTKLTSNEKYFFFYIFRLLFRFASIKNVTIIDEQWASFIWRA